MAAFGLAGWAVLVVGAAVAAPEVTVPEPGVVLGSVHLAAAPQVLREGLADPRWVSSIDGGSTTVVVTGADGPCLLADYTSPSAVMTVRYSVKQCPTADGVVTTLVSSRDFSSYEARWSVQPYTTGSTLSYRLVVASRLPVPESLMTGITRRSVVAMLEKFAARFGEL